MTFQIRVFVVALTFVSSLAIGAGQSPTFVDDVAPIIHARCTSCHREGEIAPFPLVTYQDVAANASLIGFVTASRYMPPWKPSHGSMDFLGDRSLTDKDIDVIARWVEAGTPQGDPSRTPLPPTFPEGSQLGVPDLVLEMSEEWEVEPDNRDVYRFFVLPTELLEDRSIAALEFRPGNPKVVHHVLYFLDTSGTARRLDAEDPGPGYSGFGDPGFSSAASYLGWVPGSQQRFFPSTIGARMLKGSDLVIQIHYAPSLTRERDRSRINVFFHKNPNVRVLQQFVMSPDNLPKDTNFVIWPNTVRRFVTRYTIPLDISLLGIAPHMHLLGRNCRSYAVTPDGDTIDLVRIEDWDFNWQGSYAYRHLVKIPRHSVLHYEADYDNTVDNPLNPNHPPEIMRWGESTVDEMLLCYYFWLPYRAGDESMSLETTTSVHDRSGMTSLTATCAPNPVSETMRITVALPSPTALRMDIVDAIGSNVRTITDGSIFTEGLHHVPVDVKGLNGGAYFVRISTATSTTTLPVHIVH